MFCDLGRSFALHLGSLQFSGIKDMQLMFLAHSPERYLGSLCLFASASQGLEGFSSHGWIKHSFDDQLALRRFVDHETKVN